MRVLVRVCVCVFLLVLPFNRFCFNLTKDINSHNVLWIVLIHGLWSMVYGLWSMAAAASAAASTAASASD